MAKQAKPSRGGTTRGGQQQQLLTTVRELAEIAAAYDLSEVIVSSREATLTVRRGAAAPPATPVYAPSPTAIAQSAPSPAASPEPTSSSDDKSHVVTSPFVGTFYRRPNPDSPSYVSVGQRVEKGAVLCIVEAMKLMNEIEAEVAGTVTAILAEDGSSVEYGQPLFKIAV